MENTDKIIGFLHKEAITIDMYEGRKKVSPAIKEFFYFLAWVKTGCITKY